MNATQPTKPVLRWPGGKRRLLKELLPLVPPPSEAHCYCEVFAGSAVLLLTKPRHSTEVVNDLNSDIVALMRNAHHHLPALLEELSWFIASRQDFQDFKAQPGLTEIQRAARFLLRNRVSFGGGGASFGVAKAKGGGVGFDRDEIGERLEGIRRRLNKVVVENLPYERCLQNYDSPNSFFFLDPPYVGGDIKAYSPWKQEDMVTLRTRLDRLQGRWLLTVNDSPDNRKLFGDCRVRPVTTRNLRANKRTHADATFGELIIQPA
ncbi:MAG: DNA adenine methylase [Limisphaerales bacterium]|nr:MAG: DNA adenine methylase [Limisphaerales bacterium]KAG0508093.1 MAG: DNA adenine methylase [Limisphaerales bacterium]TXT53054.1 MAG: DNA adenine methylase [Limisphaerales bacterium]